MTPDEFNENVDRLRGLTLRGVRYYEVPSEQPMWNEFANFDIVDQGLDLIFDSDSFRLTWDSTFWNYGLIVRHGLMVDFLTTALVSTVSEKSRWRTSLGQKISDVEVIWEQIPQENEQFENNEYYPQSIVIRFGNGQRVFLSAAQFREDSSDFFGMSDNVVVFFDEVIAKKSHLF